MTAKKNYFKTFCRISTLFGTTQDQDRLLDLIVESAVEAMDAKAACLFLSDEDKDVFVPMAQAGLSKNYLHTKPEHAKQTIDSILAEGGYLSIYDALKDPRVENHAEKKAEGIASILVVPVLVKSKTIGVLTLYTGTPRKFSKDEIEFLTALATQGGLAIENARLIEQIRKNIEMFLDLSASIGSSLDLKTILQALTEEVAQAITVKGASIRLLNEDKTILQLVASYGLSEKYQKKGPISAEKSIAEALKGKPVVVKNAQTDKGVQYREEKKEEGIVSILCVPIKSKETVIGVLRLYSAKEREFTQGEINLVTALAAQGGLAIQNAGLYLMLKDDLKDMKENTWIHKCWF